MILNAKNVMELQTKSVWNVSLGIILSILLVWMYALMDIILKMDYVFNVTLHVNYALAQHPVPDVLVDIITTRDNAI